MAQDISHLLQCPICTDEFNDSENKPKGLPCFHTFCLKCMRRLAEPGVGPQHGKLLLKCPNDNTTFRVPSDDVSNFRNNLTILSLLDINAKRVAGVARARDGDDIKNALSTRLETIQQEVGNICSRQDKAISSWDTEVTNTKKAIRKSCKRLRKCFKQAVDARQATLTNSLESFSKKRKMSLFSEEEGRQLEEIKEFSLGIGKDLNLLSEKTNVGHLDKCLDNIESLKVIKSKFENENSQKWTAEFLENSDEVKLICANITKFGQLILKDPNRTDNGRELQRGPVAAVHANDNDDTSDEGEVENTSDEEQTAEGGSDEEQADEHASDEEETARGEEFSLSTDAESLAGTRSQDWR